MNTFESLSEAERQEFLKFPVYISLLAANRDGETDEKEIKAASAFDQMKTYTCNPLLGLFYEKAQATFTKSITELDHELPKGKKARDIAITAALAELEKLLLKFDKIYAATMHKSMKSFTEHVSAAHWNVLEAFVFPVPIEGLTNE